MFSNIVVRLSFTACIDFKNSGENFVRHDAREPIEQDISKFDKNAQKMTEVFYLFIYLFISDRKSRIFAALPVLIAVIKAKTSRARENIINQKKAKNYQQNSSNWPDTTPDT